MTYTAQIPEVNVNPEIDPRAKVWIYQSPHLFTDIEKPLLEAKLENFVGKWHAHGTDLRSYYQVFFNRFICLFVDETASGASGCSIDSSVHFIQELEKTFDRPLMNRTDVAFINSEGKIEVKKQSDLKIEIAAGKVSKETLVFNNLVATKGEMESKWLVPMGQSWHKRMFS